MSEATAGGATFVLSGRRFCFLGANNYYVSYKPREMTDELLETAHAMGLRVLRVWANIDRGSLDESVASIDPPGSKDGVYYQYWDAQQGRARFNDGADGLARMDYLLHRARGLDLKLILVLTNNWHPFGGMDQYAAWYGLDQHRAFYEDPRIMASYKAWAAHLVERRNSVDGMLYRDDPTIFAWELANEPRCPLSPSAFSGQEGCAPDTVSRWVRSMASYLHAIDPHHLVSAGDEGFLAGGDGFGYDGSEGVDHAALVRMPEVDFATYHLYPDTWHTDGSWSRRWIESHIALARSERKPTLLEEYGWKLDRLDGASPDESLRAAAYLSWQELVIKRGGNGALFWMLAGHDERGWLYPDYDHFSVYRGDAVGRLLSASAPRFNDQSVACRVTSADVGASADSPYVSVLR